MAPFHIVLGIFGTSREATREGRLPSRRVGIVLRGPSTVAKGPGVFPGYDGPDAKERSVRAGLHGRVPETVARGAARRALVDRSRRHGAAALQPRQGLLAVGGLHEGRLD